MTAKKVPRTSTVEKSGKTKPKPKAAPPQAAKPVAEPKKPRGGQVIHEPTAEKKAEIIDRLCEGEPWTFIRRSGWDPAGKNVGQPVPSTTTLWGWEKDDPAFAENIARAREAGQLALLEDGFNIVDDSSLDYRFGLKGGLVKTDAVDRAKLRAWYRLQMADRLNPAKFSPGKRIMDGEGNPVMPTVIEIIGVPSKRSKEK